MCYWAEISVMLKDMAYQNSSQVVLTQSSNPKHGHHGRIHR